MKSGKLTVVTGPMFAGKTTWLLQELARLDEENKKCLVLRPVIDNRYGDNAIYAHGGNGNYPATEVDTHDPNGIISILTSIDGVDTVVVDEAMFFPQALVEVIEVVLAQGTNVIAAGLDTDYRREPFGVMPELMKMANSIVRLQAECYECGREANWTVRLAGTTDVEQVGAACDYQPACDEHYTLYVGQND